MRPTVSFRSASSATSSARATTRWCRRSSTVRRVSVTLRRSSPPATPGRSA